jgi:hypothetical protein
MTHRIAGFFVVTASAALFGCVSSSNAPLGGGTDASFPLDDAGTSFDAPADAPGAPVDAPFDSPTEAATPGTDSGPGGFQTGQSATLVLGQPTLTSGNTPNCTASTMATPIGIRLIGSALYVAAESDHRVLIWNALPTQNGQAADRVLGQPTLGTGNQATECAANAGGAIGGNTLDYPADVATDGTVLAVLDHGNNRLLVFSAIPTSGNAPTASYALNESGVTAGTSGGCSPSSTTLELEQPQGMALAGGKLVVADTGNNRTLVWSALPGSSTPFEPENVLLGQTLDTSCTAATGGAVTSQTQSSPAGVWSDGTRLAVADTQNNRVLLWSTFPTTANQAPDLVLGPTLTGAGTLASPGAVTSDGTQLVVADTSNNRVLIWSAFPTTTSQVPDVVLGQANLTATGSGGGASSLSKPGGLLLNANHLWVSDTNNNRVLYY